MCGLLTWAYYYTCNTKTHCTVTCRVCLSRQCGNGGVRQLDDGASRASPEMTLSLWAALVEHLLLSRCPVPARGHCLCLSTHEVVEIRAHVWCINCSGCWIHDRFSISPTKDPRLGTLSYCLCVFIYTCHCMFALCKPCEDAFLLKMRNTDLNRRL